MRIISQDGTIDVPYDYFSLSMASGKYEDVEVAYIYCHNLSSPNGTKLAEYSTKEKAINAVEMLREVYAGMPIVMQNVNTPKGAVKKLEVVQGCGIGNIVFQFPQDDEIEV
nr:MAG TPA: UPF0339 protein [Caudoviricetes sp.]